MMARLVATAMPLSAPSVVPLAMIRLSLRTSSIGSFVKSWTWSLVFLAHHVEMALQNYGTGALAAC